MDMNISTDKMPDYTDFSLMENFCSYLNISTLVYPTETSVYNSGVPRNFFRGGSTNSVEDRENGDLGAGTP